MFGSLVDTQRYGSHPINDTLIQYCIDGTGEWISYPSIESVFLEDAGLVEIEVYIQRCRDTVFTFINNREIYRECLELETDVENSECESNLLI